MYNRQYSGRNQRNRDRGVKVKHALRNCIIVAVTFWLFYQVIQSHDKTKELEENDSKGRGSTGGLIKIRRKSIVPPYEEIVTDNKQHNDAMEEEGIAEDSRDSDDERYDPEVEESDTEIDEVRNIITLEAREEVIDRGAGEEISDNSNGRKQENFVDASGHDRGNKSNHEAREKFYEADDASSAVTHANHSQTAENETEVMGISDQHQENISEPEIKDDHSEEAENGEIKKQLEVDGGEISDAAATNVTNSETKKNHEYISEKGPSQINASTEAPNNNLEASNSAADVTAQDLKSPELNVTESVPKLDHDEGIVTEGTSTQGSSLKTIGMQQANDSTLAVEIHFSVSNSTGRTASKDLESNDTDFFTLVRMTRSEHSLQDGTSTQKNETESDTDNSRDAKYLVTDL